MFEPTTLDQASAKAIHLERRGKNEQDNHSKKIVTTMKKEAKPSCTHCEKEGHDEKHCSKLHPKLKPKRNGRKEKQKNVATMQHGLHSYSNDEVKITTLGFIGVKSIDLGSDCRGWTN